MWQTDLALLWQPLLQTFYMVFAAFIFATIIGLPLGILLFITRRNQLLQSLSTHFFLSGLVSCVRSIPFIILMIAVIPLTRFLVGTSIGTTAAIVPLTFCAIPFMAKIVENALAEVPAGLIEAATAMGATKRQIISKVLLIEARPSLIRGLTLTIINLVGYSAMAGAIGGGGLGDLAIRYGYQRFDIGIMLATIIVLILFVQFLQISGDTLIKRLCFYK